MLGRLVVRGLASRRFEVEVEEASDAVGVPGAEGTGVLPELPVEAELRRPEAEAVSEPQRVAGVGERHPGAGRAHRPPAKDVEAVADLRLEPVGARKPARVRLRPQPLRSARRVAVRRSERERKPAPVPVERYVFAQWKKARVNIDYHVEVERHYYSVPHALVGRQLDVRLTATTAQCLYRGQRVATRHVRSPLRGRHTTVDEHIPEKHQKMGQWSPERFTRWARTIGPHTAALIEAALRSRRHPQQAFRSCLGILRLAHSYREERLEAAAGRAETLGANSYRSVESILAHRLDERPSEQIELGLPIEHTNLRGPSYYN